MAGWKNKGKIFVNFREISLFIQTVKGRKNKGKIFINFRIYKLPNTD